MQAINATNYDSVEVPKELLDSGGNRHYSNHVTQKSDARNHTKFKNSVTDGIDTKKMMKKNPTTPIKLLLSVRNTP